MSHRKKNKHQSRHHTHAVKPANLAAPVSLPATGQPVTEGAASHNKRYRQNLSPVPAASPTDE